MMMRIVTVCLLILTINGGFTEQARIKSYNSDYQDVLANLDSSKCDFNRTYNLDMSEIKISFLDFQDKINRTRKLNEFNITDLDLDPKKKLIVYAHSLTTDTFEESIVWVTETFRELPGIYLIIVDYSFYTLNLQPDEYFLAALRSYYIGQALGQVLSQVKSRGMPSKNIHCIGFSMGAQIVGYAAEEYSEIAGEKLGRLSGIDPSGVCFGDASPTEQIRSGLADYVDVHHCTEPILTSNNNLGDADFYYNSVHEPQPGCAKGYTFPVMGRVDDPAICSHNMCLAYWLRTVYSPYLYPAFPQDGANEEGVPFAGYYRSGNFSGVLNVTT